MFGDDKGVDLGLSPVCGVCGRELFELGFGGFDFLDEDGIVFGEQSVYATAYFEGYRLGIDEIGNRDFRLVAGGSSPLDLLMSASAFDHAIGLGESSRDQIA